jgi:hypothetical protein
MRRREILSAQNLHIFPEDGNRRKILKINSQSYLTTDGQSASLFWRSDFLSNPRKLSSDICVIFSRGALSDGRTGL